MSKFHPLAPASGGKEEDHDSDIPVLSHGCPSGNLRKFFGRLLMKNRMKAV